MDFLSIKHHALHVLHKLMHVLLHVYHQAIILERIHVYHVKQEHPSVLILLFQLHVFQVIC